jgi:small-conductance mechanosensitive channel
MRAADVAIGASFWVDYRDEITAGITVLIAFGIAEVVDRALARRGRALSERGISAEVDTRLRLIRRLVFVLIVVIGIALALAQFAALKRLATGILASSAVLGLVVGFAARQTLANAIAGVLLAITQPIRIGDLVTFEEKTGTVEDVRLTYTFLRGGDGRRIIIPNERLASSTIENHTIVDARSHVEVAVWIPPDADAQRAIEVLEREEGVDAEVAESERDGIRLRVGTWADGPEQRGDVEARILASSLERLREEGLASHDRPPEGDPPPMTKR